jgi:phospholipid/cholesterol/gamma-HCH transport system substrate-binding protein
METRINYMLVGLFVIVASCGLVVAGFWLSIGLSQKQFSTYVVYLDESASGLNVKSPVKYNGVQVGNVGTIKLDNKDPNRVEVFLNIEKGVPISTGTRARLDAQGLTGVAYMELTGGGENFPVLQPQEGEQFPVIANEPSFLFRLDKALDDLAKHFDSLSDRFSDLLSEDNVDAASGILKNTQVITETVANNDQAIDKILRNSDKTMEQLPDTVVNVNKTVEQLSTLIQQVDQLTGKAGIILQNTAIASQTINQQVLPKTNKVLEQAYQLFYELQQLTQQLENNPSVLIRGRQALPPGPGEQ